jgi:DNA-binding NarL/FixJ family response regulator
LAGYLDAGCRSGVTHGMSGHYREPFELLHSGHTRIATVIPRLWAARSSRSAASQRLMPPDVINDNGIEHQTCTSTAGARRSRATEDEMSANPVEAPATAPQIPTQLGPGFAALVVDDHPLVREALAGRLRSLGARDVVEAASYAEARARARSMPPTLAIVDLALPDGSGLELLAELRRAGWTKLIVLSAADDPYSVRAAFVAGAQGYLLKSTGSVTLTDGLRRVLDGAVYADPSVASLLAVGLRGGPGLREGLSGELSAREVEVLRRVADGRSNKEIGDELSLSALTVKSHLVRIGRKLGTGDRAEMVALTMRTRVIR